MTEDSLPSLKCRQMPRFLIKRNIKVVKNSDIITRKLYKEDVLYSSTVGDFLKGDKNLTITNKLNLLTKNSITVARYEGEASLDRTSENITRIIGQSNYDTLFSALCSVISYELKIRGILALLTVPKKIETISSQTEDRSNIQKLVQDKSCQTDETYLGMYVKEKARKRLRRQHLTPYVVTDAPKQKVANVRKVVIYPEELKNCSIPSLQTVQTDISSCVSTVSDNQLTELHLNEDSNESLGKLSSFTANSVPELYTNPLSMLDNIDKVTAVENVGKPAFDWSNNTTIKLPNGFQITLPFKVEDYFHIATQDVMKFLVPEDRKKLLCYQANIDWMNCLSRNKDNLLPIHEASKNGDLDLLRRQCFVLKARNESVDIPTSENETALHISLYGDNPACTAMLLHFGADALVTDEEYRTCFHLAAENHPGHLKALVSHCQMEPMKILQENEELWKPELATKPIEYLSKYLLRKISTMFDNDGNTPLMVACKLANFENVETLIQTAPDTINVQNPNSGNTALYFAVAAACLDSSHRGNKSKISAEFKKTIELLVENGADPAIDNHSGSNVNTVLTDLNIGECSMLIANKMTSRNCFDGVIPSTSKTCNAFMLIKGNDGKLDVKDIVTKQEEKPIMNPIKNIENSPVILENIKIERNSPVLKRMKKERSLIAVSGKKLHFDAKTKEILLKPVKVKKESDVKSNYMNSFKSFVENVTGSNLKSTVPIANSKPKIKHDKTSVVQEVSFTLKPITADSSKTSAVTQEPGTVITSNNIAISSKVKEQDLIDLSKVYGVGNTNARFEIPHATQTSDVSNAPISVKRASMVTVNTDHAKHFVKNIKRVRIPDVSEVVASEGIPKKKSCQLN